MTKIELSKYQLLEFQRHFTEILKRFNDEGERIPYNSMYRMKSHVTNREAIIIEEMFEVKK